MISQPDLQESTKRRLVPHAPAPHYPATTKSPRNDEPVIESTASHVAHAQQRSVGTKHREWSTLARVDGNTHAVTQRRGIVDAYLQSGQRPTSGLGHAKQVHYLAFEKRLEWLRFIKRERAHACATQCSEMPTNAE